MSSPNGSSPCDLIALTGDLGAAKTTFARALIRQLDGVPALEAFSSPTFTLMQIYDGSALILFQIVHADLYRIERPDELARISAGKRPSKARWSSSNGQERAGDLLNQPDRLDIAFRSRRVEKSASTIAKCRAAGGGGPFAKRGFARARGPFEALLQAFRLERGQTRLHAGRRLGQGSCERLIKSRRPASPRY